MKNVYRRNPIPKKPTRGYGNPPPRNDFTAEKNARNERVKVLKTFKVNLLRIGFIVVVAFLCFQIIIIKMEHGDEYEQKTIMQLIENSIESDKAILPNRGSIYDRNDKSFAVSRTVYTCFLDIKILLQHEKEIQNNTIKCIVEYLGYTESEIRSILENENYKNSNYYIIKKQLHRDDYSEIQKHIDEKKIRCLYFEEDTLRTYTLGTVAPQVIGFLRSENRWGLERFYDTQLTGIAGRIFRQYDTSGSIVTERINPEEGYKLVTTLDLVLQQKAEAICLKYGEETKAKNTSIMIMDPNTGEMIVMAQYPTFDLRDPLNIDLINSTEVKNTLVGKSDSEKLEGMNRIWTNYCVTSTYEPGSIFKPVTVAMALEEGIISPQTTFYCPGKSIVNGLEIGCHETRGHGTITLSQALAYSCNVAMMDIGEKLGRELFYKYQRDFGFGEKTGIDLPSEVGGASSLLHSVEALGPIELATSSFGQRFNATPIQDIVSFAACINGGYVLKPYCVSQMLDESNNVVASNNTTVVRKVISKETSDYLRIELEKVMRPDATGRRAAIPGYRIGGKTGTGEQGVLSEDDYTLSILGYFPVDNPQYLVMAIIDHPANYVEHVTSPAPMLQEMMQEIINHKKIPPDDESSLPENAQSSNQLVKVENYIGMTVPEATKNLNMRGMDYKLVGRSGSIVISQFPKPGTEVPRNTEILITITDADGFEMVEVPDFLGMTEDQAITIAEAAGLIPIFKLVENNGEASQNQGSTSAVAQMPAKGIVVPSGTEVKILIGHKD